MEIHNLKFKRGLSASKRNAIKATYQKLINKRKKRIDVLNKPVLQLANESNKALRKVIRKTDEKAAAALRNKTKREVSLALLKNNNPAIQDAEKSRVVRARFNTAFRKEVKNYTAIAALKDKFNKDFRDRLENVISGFTILDDIVIADLPELEIDPGDGAIFKPPYEFADEDDIRAGFADASIPIVDLQSGFISYRFSMEHEAPNWFNDPRGIAAYVGVGVSFVMPRTGVLRVTLTMQSTLARLRARITDNFGWSDGDVHINAGVYMNVLHPNNISVNELMMTNLTLSSDGDDVNSFINNLPNEIPYIVQLTSTGAFAQGELLQIVAGTVVKAGSRVDDMTSELSAVVSWQVKRIFVQVV